MELRFCNASVRMGAVTICQISGEGIFRGAVTPAMTAGLGQSKQELVSLLQLLNAAITSANLTLGDHVNEFSLLLVV